MNLTKGKTAELQYDFTGLHNFVNSLGQSGKFVVKVGIFGDKTSRTAAGKLNRKLGHRTKTKTPAPMTNAEVGLVHELGSPSRNIPQRSFLRMPLSFRSKEILAETRAAAAKSIAEGNIKTTLNILGAACVKQIRLAFVTWGFGKWPANTLSTVERKGSNSPLIDTSQLQRSITYQVEEK